MLAGVAFVAESKIGDNRGAINALLGECANQLGKGTCGHATSGLRIDELAITQAFGDL